MIEEWSVLLDKKTAVGRIVVLVQLEVEKSGGSECDEGGKEYHSNMSNMCQFTGIYGRPDAMRTLSGKVHGPYEFGDPGSKFKYTCHRDQMLDGFSWLTVIEMYSQGVALGKQH